LQQTSAREQQMTIAAENNRRSSCTMLFNQLRQNDLAMRQGNAWDNMAQLKANRQAIVNQRGQLGC
jgi:predicted RNA-binding protein with PIN domain